MVSESLLYILQASLHQLLSLNGSKEKMRILIVFQKSNLRLFLTTYQSTLMLNLKGWPQLYTSHTAEDCTCFHSAIGC